MTWCDCANAGEWVGGFGLTVPCTGGGCGLTVEGVCSPAQVEGLVGTFIANTRDPVTRFGSTVISYDKGGNWVQLRPPTLDRNGEFIDCQQVSDIVAKL